MPRDSDPTTFRIGRKLGDAPLRGSLIALCAGVVLPVLLMVGYLLWEYTDAERRRMESEAVASAQTFAAAIDREVASLARTLDVLATSDDLARGNLADFHDRITRVARRHGINIVLVDRDNQQAASTRVPWGTPLPKNAAVELYQRVFASRAMEVADLFIGAVAQDPLFAVSVPVTDAAGEMTHFLSASLPADHLLRLIAETPAPAGWVVSVVDRKGVIMARSARHGEFVGKQATADLRDNATRSQGTWIGTTIDGRDVLGAYAKSRQTGWTVAVGVDQAYLNAPILRSLGVFAGIGMVALGLSLAMAWHYGRRITSPLRALVAGASVVGSGGVYIPRGFRIREINKVADALATASIELRGRERDLAQSEARFKEIASSIDQVFHLFDPASRRSVYLSPAFERLWGRPAPKGEDATSQWLAGIHPEDRAAALAAMTSPGKTPHDIEYRVLRPDGGLIWIRDRSYPTSGPHVVAVASDITRDKDADERQTLMMRELHHRVRNTLATVLAISRQTARSATDIQDFERSFDARIRSLSRTHTLLMGGNWETICLKDIVAGEVAPYDDEEGTRVTVEGDSTPLRSDMAVSVGMAMHELATNAAKHGSWSNPRGHVRVAWHRDDGPEPHLHLSWTETGGPTVSPPSRKGFGSQLLQRALSAQLGADVRIDYLPTGLACRIDIPLLLPQAQAAA